MTDRKLSLSDFLCLFGDCLDAARFAGQFDRGAFVWQRGAWHVRGVDGALTVSACGPVELERLLAVAREALAHPSTQRRHSDYCPHSRVARGETYANNSPVLLCSCPPEVREREDRRRQADPLLRAVDAVGEARP